MDNPKYKFNLRTLHLLLVFSFINTGCWLLFDLMLGASNTEARASQLEIYNTIAQKDDSFSVYAIFMEHQQQKPQWYCVLCAILDATSIIGMVLMWRIRKNGVHCYTLSKLLLMLMPLLFLDRSFIGLGDIMIGVLFIAYYFFLLKALGAFGSSPLVSTTDTENNTPTNSEDNTNEE